MGLGWAVHDGAVDQPQPQVVHAAEYLHAWPVLLGVVVAAPHDQVVEIATAAVFPGQQVVDVAPRRGDVAPRPAAPAIAYHQRLVLGVGGVAHLAPEIENLRAGQQNPLQVGLLGEEPHHMSRHRVAMGGDARLVAAAGVGVGGGGDEQGGPLAPTGDLTLRVRQCQLQ